MMEFHTFEDVLDFAILQEKAAQQFYTKLSDEIKDSNVLLFYKTLIQEEALHEKKLRELKRFEYELIEPDVDTLRNSGYLDAMPISPEVTFEEAVRYAIKKEKSARMLYRTLGQMCERKELADLFEELAAEEKSHADYFQSEYKDMLATSGS
ncbi:MAG: ferritin-like domain-containing protein [Planctomycetota bacterium]|jgi:rubrerythrin